MMNIKVTFNQYDDLKPRETLVNGVEPNPILTKANGIEYFIAKAGMILTVSEERAKYLVEERKLAEYVEADVITLNANDIDNITGVNEIPEGADVVEGVVITEGNDDAKEDEEVEEVEIIIEVEDNNEDNKQEDEDNNDDEGKENILINNDELETADKKIDNLEKAVKKTTRKK